MQVKLDSVSLGWPSHSASDGDYSVPGYLASMLLAPIRCMQHAPVADASSPASASQLALRGVSLTLLPGSSTAILAAPGAGATSLLKLVTGRKSPTAGSLSYNGMSLPELSSKGVYVSKLASFCAATDEHEALLTVREVVEFAHTAAVASSVSPAPDATDGASQSRFTLPSPTEVIAALGLSRAADTIAGGLVFRGLSGGEKRRLSVAETLALGGRVVALDCPTNGLDSSTAYETMSFAIRCARESRGVLIAAMQQPTPETLAMFDDVLLLAGGRVLFHGPVSALDGYLERQGYGRPGYAELAEWALEVVCNPDGAAAASIEARFGDNNGSGGSRAVPTAITVDQLADAWDSSPERKALVTHAIAAPGAARTAGVPIATPFARAQYGASHAASFSSQVWLAFKRELLLARRNWLYVAARLMLTIGMGFILGSVFPYINSDKEVRMAASWRSRLVCCCGGRPR